MAAANTDRFTQVGNPGTATTLAAPGHAIAGTSITVGSTSNWPTSTGVIFAIDTVTLVNGVEVRDIGSYTEWEGVVTSGTTVSSLVLRYGTDQNYPAGSTTRVYIPVASSRENRLVDGLLVQHNQDGTHGTITATSVGTDTIVEKTAAAGVTIDGVNLKDSKVNTANSVEDLALSATRSAFKATRLTAQSIPNNTYTKVAYDTEVNDNLGEYDPTTNYRYTVQKAGTYIVRAHFRFETAIGGGNDGRIRISKNGTALSEVFYEAPGNFTTLQIVDVMQLAANDYIEIFAFQLSGGAININGDATGTNFSAARV